MKRAVFHVSVFQVLKRQGRGAAFHGFHRFQHFHYFQPFHRFYGFHRFQSCRTDPREGAGHGARVDR